MEDLFSSIIVAIIAIISIVIKATGNKPKKSSPRPPFAPETFVKEEEKATTAEPKMANEGRHPDSLETIFDEIFGHQPSRQSQGTPATKAAEQAALKQQPRRADAKPKRKNATNRTFQRDNEMKSQLATNTKKEPKKFNIREAIIYNEILTPKFKKEE